MTPLVSPDALEAMAFSHPGSTIEQDPSGTRHLVDINGHEVAWAVSPGTALAEQHIADAQAAAGIGGGL